MHGHMILKKTIREGVGPTSSAAILGLKVVGGQLLETGGRGAIIEKVKKGSTADIEGQLRPGKSVLLISIALTILILINNIFCCLLYTSPEQSNKRLFA